MTFILIASSLTMVLAVEAGHRKDQKTVKRYMVYTIIGGLMFLGCQALEWSHLLHQGLWIGVSENDFKLEQELHDGEHHGHGHAKEWIAERRVFYPVKAMVDGKEVPLNDMDLKVVDKPILDGNGVAFRNAHGDYVNPGDLEVVIPSGESMMFGKLFFFITGFHGFHVFSGVVFLFIITIMVSRGIFQKRGHYEMVEKVGLYWHFVDLVWVFVFTLFYLI